LSIGVSLGYIASGNAAGVRVVNQLQRLSGTPYRKQAICAVVQEACHNPNAVFWRAVGDTQNIYQGACPTFGQVFNWVITRPFGADVIYRYVHLLHPSISDLPFVTRCSVYLLCVDNKLFFPK
jgi:hypothetical protein